jgi:hypothetical protein
MKNNLRGQVATEFFLYTSVFLFVVIAAFFIVSQVQSTEIPLRENTLAKETGDFFSSSILLAVKGGAGFTYDYTFPRTILGRPYTMTFSPDDNLMILDWEGRYGNFSHSYSLPDYPYDLSGSPTTNCIKPNGRFYVFNSSSCTNVLKLHNTGSTLQVIHNVK